MKTALHTAIFILLLTPATAETISGRASVIDGDTLEIHGTRIRLAGIDAPESRQTCTDIQTRQRVRCGQMSAFALAGLVDGHVISCRSVSRDKYRRTLGQCTAGGKDLSAEMVRSGWALAYRQFSRAYLKEEKRAKAARSGVWSMKFTRPWVWRKKAAH